MDGFIYDNLEGIFNVGLNRLGITIGADGYIFDIKDTDPISYSLDGYIPNAQGITSGGVFTCAGLAASVEFPTPINILAHLVGDYTKDLSKIAEDICSIVRKMNRQLGYSDAVPCLEFTIYGTLSNLADSFIIENESNQNFHIDSIPKHQNKLSCDSCVEPFISVLLTNGQRQIKNEIDELLEHSYTSNTQMSVST